MLRPGRLGQRPVHFEVRAPQAQRLIQLEALVRLTLIGAVDLAVDRHPLVQALRVEHQVIDRLGRRGNVDLRSDFTHVALSISRNALSTEAAKRCRRTPKVAAASPSRGSRSCSSDSISGSISPGSSSATAAARTEATGVRLNGRAIAGRWISITPAMRSSSSS